MGDLVVTLLVVVVAVVAILKVRGQMSGAPVIRRQLTQSEEATVAAAEPGTLVRLTGVIQPVGEARISEISSRPFVARDDSEADALGAKITITGSDQPVVIVTPD